MKGHMENGSFKPHNDSSSKKMSAKTMNTSTSGGEEMKGLPKSFKGYDVMKRKTVTVTKDIHKIKFKNGRTALQGISPVSGNKITRIIA